MIFQNKLEELAKTGNLRKLPPDTSESLLIDFSSNDYLGLAKDSSLKKLFLESLEPDFFPPFSSSASRLLSASQDSYYKLESAISALYGKEALLFNSGYHANSGIIPAVTSLGKTLILADKLVHASIIDGVILSRCDFKRFPHNDLHTLEKQIKINYDKYDNIWVVTESVFSMDGDKAPLKEIQELKKRYPKIMTYIDEAHAFGVEGAQGLGLSKEIGGDWDIVVGTFGKAGASVGAFGIFSPTIKNYLLNTARSFIFSTSLPPLNIEWTHFILNYLVNADMRRARLKKLSRRMTEILSPYSSLKIHESHIQPLIIGDAQKTVLLSEQLMKKGIKALPIRRPTVAPGTERLRFSLSADMSEKDLDQLKENLENLMAYYTGNGYYSVKL